MSGNIKFRWFLLAPILVALFVVVASPVISWAGELEDAREQVRKLDFGLDLLLSPALLERF